MPVSAPSDALIKTALFPSNFWVHRWEASRVYVDHKFHSLGIHALYKNESLNKLTEPQGGFFQLSTLTQTKTDGLSQTFSGDHSILCTTYH